MPTASEVSAYRRAQQAVSAAARGHLASFWSSLDVWQVDAVRDALEQFFPALAAQYGDAAAALAADWFELTVGSSAVLGSPVAELQANASMRWALGDILKGNPARSLAALSGVLDRLVKQPGRDTIRQSAASAGIGYARVPSGSETCAFCLMLASRGGVYESKRSALRKSDGDKYHDDCNCVAVPVRGADDYPAGYDPAALDALYVSARNAAGSGDPTAILSKLREQQGTN